MKRLEKNIKIDYIYKFFTSFDITAAIWVLYLSYKGLNLIEIGILESFFHITGLIFEIPTGALADLLGRKRVILIGRVCSIIASITMLFSSRFFGFAIGFIIHALSYNLNSGSEEALIYDSLKEINKEDSYIEINGRLNLIIEVAQSLAVFIGGMLADKDFGLSYIVAILIGICSLGVSLMFKETERIENRESICVSKHFKDSINILRENKVLRNILIYIPCICAFSTTTYFYGQQFFGNMGISKSYISIIFLINGLCAAIGSVCSESVEKKFKEKSFVIITTLMGVTILLFGITSGVLNIISFLSLGFFTAIIYPISSNKINSIIPSEQRATIISVESMMFSISMIVIFPCVGWIGELVGLKLAFIFIGIVGIVYSIIAKLYIKIK